LEETNTALLHRWFQEVWNERREAAIDELMAPDVKAHGLGPEPLDREGFKSAWRFFLDTFSSLEVEMGDIVAQGEKTAARLVVRGVHTGEGLGIAATGNNVQFDVQAISTWRDGQLIEGWNVVDMAAVHKQIGMI
jgi:predicted ester cyclase